MIRKHSFHIQYKHNYKFSLPLCFLHTQMFPNGGFSEGRTIGFGTKDGFFPKFNHCDYSIGPEPVEQYGTRAVFSLSDEIDNTCWSAAVTSPPGDTVCLSVCAAPDAPIGRYILTLDARFQLDFILLFNPWCTGK